VTKARSLVERTPLEGASVEEIVQASARQGTTGLFNSAAQAWNHAFYWRCMRPGGGGDARGSIAGRIEQDFGNQRTFVQQFVAAAGDQFGSGWAWLVLDEGHLKVTTTSNALTPLVGSQVPLLTVDVWEHAYYLDYQHRRLDYVAAFFAHLVDWTFVERNLVDALARATIPSAIERTEGGRGRIALQHR
jgi:Fe-Mn family superoxide dismutase